MRIDRVLAPAFLILTASSAALAARLDYTAEIGYLHSDNINLSAVDPVAENLLIPQLAFRFSEDGSVVRAQVNGLVEYRDYLGGAFGNEFRGTLDGVVDWTLIPERLKWSFADSLGLNPINLRLPDSPDNLQQTNVFSTGPTLQFRLGQSTMGQAELRYTDSYAQTTDEFNSGRLSAALRALKDLDSTRHLSANLEASKINYDNNSQQSDYTRYAGYAGYTQKLSQLDLDVALGYSHFDFDRGEHINAALIRANLNWRASAQNTFGLGVYRDISDAATSLAISNADIGNGFGGISIGGAAISPDVYKNHRIEGRYALETVRISLISAVSFGTIRYISDSAIDSDRNELEGRVDLAYKLRPNLTLGVLAGIIRRDYQVGNVDTRDTLFGAYLRQQMSRHWGWRVDIARNERKDQTDALSYHESSAYVRLIYSR